MEENLYAEVQYMKAKENILENQTKTITLFNTIKNAYRFQIDTQKKMCYSKNHLRKETSWRCKNCVEKPPLCPGKCFENFHKKLF